MLFAVATGPTVSLDSATPAVAGITFNNATTSYTIAQGSGGSITLQSGASVAVEAGTHTIAAPLSLSGNTSFDTAAGTMLTVSYAISGAGGLTKTSGGTLVLSGTNNYQGGTLVSGGTLVVSNPAALVNGGNLTVGSAAAFNAPVVPAASAAATVPAPATITAANVVTSAASQSAPQQPSKDLVISSGKVGGSGKPWWAIAAFLARQNFAVQYDDRAAAIDAVMLKYSGVNRE